MKKLSTRVLIFEDDKNVSDFLRDLLEMYQYEVLTFEHPGTIANSLHWEYCENENDIIITDYNMPVMDGVEFIVKLLNIGFRKSNIGIMSGTWTSDAKQYVRENNIHFFDKPFQFNVILNWLDTFKDETNGIRLTSENL